MMATSMQPNDMLAEKTGYLTRTVTIQTALSLAYRIGATALSYLLVPISLNYLGAGQYGIWVTLFSMMSWIALLDMGISNSLRNRLTEVFSNTNIYEAKTIVSTAYAVMLFFAILFFILLFVSASFVPWSMVFNTAILRDTELKKIVLTVGSIILLNFVLSLSQSIYYACQRASLAALSQLILHLFAVCSASIFYLTTTRSLLYLSCSYAASMLIANLLITIKFFAMNRQLLPSPAYIRSNAAGSLLSLGLTFFIIQAASLIIFTTDNIIISQLLGPEEVATYNVVWRLFSGVIFLHCIVLVPLWSAYTKAYTEENIVWIRKVLRILNLSIIPVVVIVAGLVTMAGPIIRWWAGPQINAPQLLVALMGVYTVIATWNNVYAYFVNGIGALIPQLITAVIGGASNIPLSIYLARDLQMGSSGVILGTIISLSLFAVTGPIQTRMILNKKEKRS